MNSSALARKRIGTGKAAKWAKISNADWWLDTIT